MKRFTNVPLVRLIGNLNRARSAKVPLLIAAIVAIIAFTFAACGGGFVDPGAMEYMAGGGTGGPGGSGYLGGGGGFGGGSSGGGTPGTFTLTGIPSQYNGKYAWCFDAHTLTNGVTLYGMQSITKDTDGKYTYTFSQISGGKVSLPLWVISADGDYVRYYGNDNTSSVVVNISNSSNDTQSKIGHLGAYILTYKNGGATVAWDAKKWTSVGN